VKIALAHKRLDLKGGTERDLFQTAEGLRELGHEVHLFCSEFAIAAPSGVIAHRVPNLALGRSAQLWSSALATEKRIKDRGYDAVISFGRFFAADVVRCGGGTHRGFLRRMGDEGGALRRLWQTISVYHRSVLAIEQRQFESARMKKIIAVSAAVKRDILANYAVAPDKITVLYNGVDPQRFHPQRHQYRRPVRERWKIPLEAPLVLFIGSGFRRKGLDRLISLWASKKLTNCYLLVVGVDARMERYRGWADTLAPGRIIFAGRQHEIENYYAAADLIALMSIQEAFGNVVLEALAAGLPVLVSREVGAAELLKGALLDGIVDRPDEPRELEAKLLRMLDKAHDAAVTKEARQIGETYSWDEHFRRLEIILLETCGARTQAHVS
jgi:UDP-glucose:(heptosyl)LPS alpha-1,3-glucosyltransferase